jgi:hypothetical protein
MPTTTVLKNLTDEWAEVATAGSGWLIQNIGSCAVEVAYIDSATVGHILLPGEGMAEPVHGSGTIYARSSSPVGKTPIDPQPGETETMTYCGKLAVSTN